MFLDWSRLTAAALVGCMAGCGAAAAFACESDSDCFLSGTPGVCEDGRCAYPDEACASGLSYPVATPGVGGTCVPGGGTGTDHGGGGEASGGGGTTTGAPTTNPLDETGPPATTDATTLELTSSGEGTTGGTGLATAGSADTVSDETGPICRDTVSDQVFNAEPLAGCAGQINSTLSDAEDIDWFAFFGPGAECAAGVYSAEFSVEALTLCLGAGCEAGGPTVMCTAGELTEMGAGIEGCCGGPEVAGSFECGGTADGFDPFVVVLGAPDTVECTEYVVNVVQETA